MVAISFFYTVFSLFCLLGGLILFMILRDFFIEGNGPGDSIVYAPLFLIASIVLIDILLLIASLILSWYLRRRTSIPRRRLIYFIIPIIIILSAVVFSIFTGQCIGFTRGYIFPVPIALCILVALSWMLVQVPGSLLIDARLPVRRTLRINAMLPVGFALMFSLSGLLYTFDDGPYQLIFATFEYLSVGSSVFVALYCIIRFSLAIEKMIEEHVDKAQEKVSRILKRDA